MKTLKSVGLLAFGTIVASSAAQAQEEMKRANIIVFIADDISMTDFGCYGNAVVRTPNIDALAEDGMRFTNTFLTTSSSSPSRASIITGRYPHNTGACELHSPIGDEQVSVAAVLKKGGYYTAQAGKWHFGNSPVIPKGPFTKDFDCSGGSSKDGGGESGAEKWVNYIKERPMDKPFFMWFAAHDAHREWDNNLFLERYTPEEVIPTEFYVDNKSTREDLACYYNEVSRFDYFVGQAVKELKAQRVYENTFIIVMADNGRPFPRSKTRLIPDGIKTPSIVHYPPGMKKRGSVCNSLVSVIDIAPTLTQIADVLASPTFQGRSFIPLLENPRKKFRNYAFAEHNWHDFEAYERMVCTEKYLFVENRRPDLNAEGASDIMGGGAGQSLLEGYRNGTLNSCQNELFRMPRPTTELYEYNKDSKQLNTLIQKEPKTADALLRVLHQWQQETGDSCPNELTPDWYSRDGLTFLPTRNSRKEMPGKVNNAVLINNGGPF